MTGSRTLLSSSKWKFVPYTPPEINGLVAKPSRKPSAKTNTVSPAMLRKIAAMEAGRGPFAAAHRDDSGHSGLQEATRRSGKQQDMGASMNLAISSSDQGGKLQTGPENHLQASEADAFLTRKTTRHASAGVARALLTGNGSNKKHPIVISETDTEGTSDIDHDDASSTSSIKLPDVKENLNSGARSMMLNSHDPEPNRPESSERPTAADDVFNDFVAASGGHDPNQIPKEQHRLHEGVFLADCANTPAKALAISAVPPGPMAGQDDIHREQRFQVQSFDAELSKATKRSPDRTETPLDGDEEPPKKLRRLSQRDQPPPSPEVEGYSCDELSSLHGNVAQDVASPESVAAGPDQTCPDQPMLGCPRSLTLHNRRLEVSLCELSHDGGCLSGSAFIKGGLANMRFCDFETALKTIASGWNIQSIKSITYTPGLPAPDKWLFRFMATGRKRRRSSVGSRKPSHEAGNTSLNGDIDDSNNAADDTDDDQDRGSGSEGSGSNDRLHARRSRPIQRWTATENQVLRKWNGKTEDLPSIFKALQGRTAAAVIQRWNTKVLPPVKKRRRRAR